MKALKLVSLFTSLILLITCFTSCGDSYKDEYIYIEFNSAPATLDPQLVKTIEEITVARAIYDTLLRYDSEGNIVASAAESYEKKGNSYIFYLREDAVWTDGTPVTADDFVYGFRRAVDPETNAPYAVNLFSIANAYEINCGSAPISSLGVNAINDYTLKIELIDNEPQFKEILTMPVTAPCNKDYFEACKGKYGLTTDTTASNGSYYLRVWTKEDKYLVRLAKNLDYKGEFEANSMRVYFTCSEKDNLNLLEHENTDLAFINTNEIEASNEAGYKIISTEDTCYALYIGDSVDIEVRKALLSTIDQATYKDALGSTQRVAKDLFPSSLSLNFNYTIGNVTKYDEATSQEAYNTAVIRGVDITSVVIKHPSDASSEAVAKAVASHWQQKLSCFINIESTSDSAIKSSFLSGDYDIIIMPVTSSGGIVSSYLSDLGYKIGEADNIQYQYFAQYHCYPLYYSSTNIASIKKISNLDNSIHYGIIDASQLIKID